MLHDAQLEADKKSCRSGIQRGQAQDVAPASSVAPATRRRTLRQSCIDASHCRFDTLRSCPAVATQIFATRRVSSQPKPLWLILD